MASLSYDWREAIYTALSAIAFDIDGTPIVTGSGAAPGIYDKIPQQSDPGSASLFPCVVIGVRVATESDTDDTFGQSIVTRIHTHSRIVSSREVEYMQDAIYDAIHRADLIVSGWDVLMIDREQSDVTPISEGRFQGVCEYRALLTKQ